MRALVAILLCIAPLHSTASGDYFDFVMPWDDNSQNITNLSFLNPAPAGKYGFVTSRNGHLYAGSERLRLLGVNLAFNGTTPDHETAEKIAARLARFGINAVRFHHMEAVAAPRGILNADRKTLNPEQLDRLDYFIAELKKRGIYSDINLQVTRIYPEFLPSADTLSKSAKGPDFFQFELIESQKEYAKKLLLHRNPYTGNRYVDEPAIVFVEINNENGLIHAWLAGRLDKMNEAYKKTLSARWNDWLGKRYPSTQVYPTKETSQLGKTMGVARRPMALPTRDSFKVMSQPGRQYWIQFLWETEQAYWDEMRSYLRDSLGVKSLLIGTQSNVFSPAAIQASLDVIDTHAYWDHPEFPRNPHDMNDWVMKNQPLAGARRNNPIAALALYRIAGKPFVVTEYDHPFPTPYEAEGLPLLAAYAALQDWDGIFQFCYGLGAGDWRDARVALFFDSHANPLKMAGLLSAALLYRREDVLKSKASATTPLPFELSPSAWIPIIIAKGRMPLASDTGVPSLLPLHQFAGFNTVASKKSLSIPVTSDTGELIWGAPSSSVTIDAVRTKGIIGRVGEAIERDGWSFRIDSARNQRGVLLVHVMEGKNFQHARKLLAVVMGEVRNSSTKQIDGMHAGNPWGNAPTQISATTASVSLPMSASRVRAWSLDSRGDRVEPLNVPPGGKAEIKLGADQKTLWYEIEIAP